jgi:hypothetical protein
MKNDEFGLFLDLQVFFFFFLLLCERKRIANYNISQYAHLFRASI